MKKDNQILNTFFVYLSYHKSQFSETGSSNLKCSETYHGPEGFSEVETRNIRDYVLTLEPVPVLSQCFHSYSQLWLWPYGYENGGPYPENVEEIVRHFF